MINETYNGKPFTSKNIGDHVALVYLVTDRLTGRKYIGLKTILCKRTLPALKGSTRKRKKI